MQLDGLRHGALTMKVMPEFGSVLLVCRMWQGPHSDCAVAVAVNRGGVLCGLSLEAA